MVAQFDDSSVFSLKMRGRRATGSALLLAVLLLSLLHSPMAIERSSALQSGQHESRELMRMMKRRWRMMMMMSMLGRSCGLACAHLYRSYLFCLVWFCFLTAETESTTANAPSGGETRPTPAKTPIVQPVVPKAPSAPVAPPMAAKVPVAPVTPPMTPPMTAPATAPAAAPTTPVAFEVCPSCCSTCACNANRVCACDMITCPFDCNNIDKCVGTACVGMTCPPMNEG
jgi:hypothetical protein